MCSSEITIPPQEGIFSNLSAPLLERFCQTIPHPPGNSKPFGGGVWTFRGSALNVTRSHIQFAIQFRPKLYGLGYPRQPAS